MAGILGQATTVDARTGRKTSNALTLTFKTDAKTTIGVATQKGGIGVLLGFKNGGFGRYTIEGNGEVRDVDLAAQRVTVTRGDGTVVGFIDEDGGGDATFRDASEESLARWHGYPYEQRADATWPYTLTTPNDAPLGTLRLLRTSTTFDVGAIVDRLVDHVVLDTSIWWERTGKSLKIPTLGARLDLTKPVDDDLGDLLLAACVDAAVGAHDHLKR